MANKKESKLEIIYLPVSSLVKLQGNPRINTDPKAIERLTTLIKEHGFQNPLNVYKAGGTYEIIAGNHRFDAGLSLGMTEFPCIVYEGSRKQALARAISDNKSNEWTDWDVPVLKDLLIELDDGSIDMHITGFNSHELELIMTAINPDEPADAEPQIDRAEELNKTWRVKSGDLWQIGEHRLLCGDSTKGEDVGRVMGGEKADMVLSDPPYGIGWETRYNFGVENSSAPYAKNMKRQSHKKIAGDDAPFDPAVWLDFPFVILWGCNYFLNKLPDGSLLVWDKRANDGKSFMSEAEAAWCSKVGAVKMFSHCWQGFSRATENSEHYHPTQKPVALMAWCIGLSENPQIIIDPFLGSGTTMVACQNLNRKCRGIEISPDYCAVILQRMFDAFGIKGVRVD